MKAQLHHLISRVRALFQTRADDREFDDELATHLEMLEAEKRRNGMSADEARRAARLEIGAVTQLREAHREVRTVPLVDTLSKDLQYTFRTLRRESSFAVFSVLILGLGIAACSTVFTAVNTLLLRDLPFHEPDRLIWMATQADDGIAEWRLQVNHVLDLRRQSTSFADLAGYYGYFGKGDRVLTGSGEPERVTIVPVTENFFSLLGVKPLIGRWFTPEECKFNGPSAAILSHAFWTRRFGADPAIVGRNLRLNDRSVTITGVLPASFDFATVFEPGTRVDMFSPYPMSEETNRTGNSLAIVGRLKPGVSVEAARAEATVLGTQIERAHPERNALRPLVRPLQQQVSGRFRVALLVLSGAVGLVMLIVCANLSNLQLARMARRQKEIAIRAALGAGRGRLIRQMLTESLVLAGCGALLGLMLAHLATQTLARLDTFSIPLLTALQVDATVLAFTAAVAGVTGVLFGVIPAMQVRTRTLHTSLKDSTRGSSSGPKQSWIRGGLVVSEIALACVLLVGAGLLIRSFMQMLDTDLGFQPENVAALRIDPGAAYPDQARRSVYYTEVLQRVGQVPGILTAGLSDTLPLDGSSSWAIRGKGQTFAPGKYPEGFVRQVTEGYLQTAGIAVRDGRNFSERDNMSSEPVVIVNETLARTLWPGENPLGKFMHSEGIFNTVPARRVVGVVADVRHRSMEQTAGCEFYLPLRQARGNTAVQLVVRSTLPVSSLSSAVRATLKPLQPNLAANEWRLFEDLVDRAASPRKFVSTLLGGFSAFALILASLGIYAVIAYSVSQRSQEFGIRMAIGASSGDLRNQVLLQTLRLAAAGVAIGAVASWMLARGMDALLFGVTAADPATYLGMIVILVTVALVAGYFPASRASRIDPMITLRAE